MVHRAVGLPPRELRGTLHRTAPLSRAACYAPLTKRRKDNNASTDPKQNIDESLLRQRRGARVCCSRWRDDRTLARPQSTQLIDHSPDGFNWGYSGSGPAQLAYALLLEVTDDEQTALRYYQDFKWDVIANLPPAWLIAESSILDWLKTKRERPQQHRIE